MEPVRVNQVLVCDTCGVELKVIKDCDSTCACNIICCGKQLSLKKEKDQDFKGKPGARSIIPLPKILLKAANMRESTRYRMGMMCVI